MSARRPVATMPSGLPREWPGEFTNPFPHYRQPVRIASEVLCEACGRHPDVNGQCRCSE